MTVYTVATASFMYMRRASFVRREVSYLYESHSYETCLIHLHLYDTCLVILTRRLASFICRDVSRSYVSYLYEMCLIHIIWDVPHSYIETCLVHICHVYIRRGSFICWDASLHTSVVSSHVYLYETCSFIFIWNMPHSYVETCLVHMCHFIWDMPHSYLYRPRMD